jgi:hypothetical protein
LLPSSCATSVAGYRSIRPVQRNLKRLIERECLACLPGHHQTIRVELGAQRVNLALDPGASRRLLRRAQRDPQRRRRAEDSRRGSVPALLGGNARQPFQACDQARLGAQLAGLGSTSCTLPQISRLTWDICPILQ